MSNDTEIYLTERSCNKYDMFKMFKGETSCFILIDEVIEWLTANNVRYGIIDSYHYMNNIELHEECNSFSEVIKVCRPKMIFTNKDQAMIFKLTWC
jgi:hypothetical protein